MIDPAQLIRDRKAALQQIHQMRADRFGKYAEFEGGPMSPLNREAIAKARMAADQELPRFTNRIGYRHTADTAPLTPKAIRKLLARLDELDVEVRALGSRKQVVLERRGEDVPEAEPTTVRESVRAIAEFLLARRRRD